MNFAVQDGSYELNNPFELNLFIDIVLDAVLKYAGKRRIVFSCFHPDICVMWVNPLVTLGQLLSNVLLNMITFLVKVWAHLVL